MIQNSIFFFFFIANVVVVFYVGLLPLEQRNQRNPKRTGVFTARKRSLRRLCFYTCLSFCPQGGVPGQVPPWDQVPPSGPGTPPRPGTPPWDQVPLPGTRYTLQGPGTPPGTRYTPLDQVHPTGPGTPWDQYSPRDQVHPPGAVHAGRYGQQVGGTHPYWNAFLFQLSRDDCFVFLSTTLLLTSGIWK